MGITHSLKFARSDSFFNLVTKVHVRTTGTVYITPQTFTNYLTFFSLNDFIDDSNVGKYDPTLAAVLARIHSKIRNRSQEFQAFPFCMLKKAIRLKPTGVQTRGRFVHEKRTTRTIKEHKISFFLVQETEESVNRINSVLGSCHNFAERTPQNNIFS